MTASKEIFNARQAVARHLAQQGATTFWGTVSDVDEPSRTCTVVIDDQPYADVLLYAITDKKLKGFCFIPKTDSTVLVSRIAGSNMMFVAMFSQVDKVLLSVGETQIEVGADEITFNGGENDGLVKIKELTEKVNALIDTFNAHVHSGVIVGVSGGSGAPAVGASGNSTAPTATATKLNKSDYENEKIKH